MSGDGAGPDVDGLTSATTTLLYETPEVGGNPDDAGGTRVRRMTAPNMHRPDMGFTRKKSSTSTRTRTGSVGHSSIGTGLLEELEHVTDRWSSHRPSKAKSVKAAMPGGSTKDASGGGGGGAAVGGASRSSPPFSFPIGDSVDELSFGQGLAGQLEEDAGGSATVSPTHPLSKRTSFSDTWTTSSLTYTIPGRDNTVLNMAIVGAFSADANADAEQKVAALGKLKALKKPGLKGWSAIRAVVRPVEGHSNWGALLAALHSSSALPASTKKEKREWKQLAGHADNFAVPDDPRFILKKRDISEEAALRGAMADPVMTPYAVPYHGTEHRTAHSAVAGKDEEPEESRDEYMKLGNLLHGFVSPSLMDIKMGQRTYTHNKSNTKKKRMDLLEKMMKVDPNEATEEEQREGVTKLRYMRFREMQSSTAELGFRIEAMHVSRNPTAPPSDEPEQGGSSFSKYFVPKSKDGVEAEIRRFLKGAPEAQRKFVARLREMRTKLPSSPFFGSHEVIGSSLLLVYDRAGNASISMLDFAKTLPSDVPVKHDIPYVYPSTSPEDGYLLGLEKLLSIVESVDVGPVELPLQQDSADSHEIANAIRV